MFKPQKFITILFVGEQGVGKTSIVRQFEKKEFKKNEGITDGALHSHTNLKFSNDKSINLTNIDVSGNKDSISLFYHNIVKSSAVVLVYDVGRKNTFEQLKYWINQVKEKISKETIVAIVGN